ncbi:hypothetical protein [Qipengyuania mesophila]|uniref:hypothetical protein n=1 Tax=Erythrobacteraceae TaxID=335929 RepID=UPI003512BA15
MISPQDYHLAIGQSLREARQLANISVSDLEIEFDLAPGWVNEFEVGHAIPKELLLPMLNYLNVNFDSFFSNIDGAFDKSISRIFYAEENGADLILRFPYGSHDATYRLPNASMDEFNELMGLFRAQLILAKREAVVQTFLKAVNLWPHANPSDVWWFLVSRAYLDILNHPAGNARLNLEQSWKRTGGWALEEIVVRFYSGFLAQHDVKIQISDDSERRKIVEQINITDRLEADKIDVTLHGRHGDEWIFFGVVHVKASFAERRTDDIHMSSLLKSAGYTSPLWTMDCKSSPSDNPINRGELGDPNSEGRSAKRRDIEDEGYFTRCFSYNRNTIPSPDNLPADRRIYTEDFVSPDDNFSRFIVQRWRAFMS